MMTNKFQHCLQHFCTLMGSALALVQFRRLFSSPVQWLTHSYTRIRSAAISGLQEEMWDSVFCIVSKVVCRHWPDLEFKFSIWYLLASICVLIFLLNKIYSMYRIYFQSSFPDQYVEAKGEREAGVPFQVPKFYFCPIV